MNHKMIELVAEDGHRLAACVAQPKGTARGGLIVVQEIFGVNSHIRAVVESYADEGYSVIAPALFDRHERGIELGYSDADIQRGRALKTACSNENALRDIAAAMAQVSPAGRIGIVGYCWGGTLSWLAACEIDGLAASVPYYGGGIPDLATRMPRCPVMAHFGESDASIPMASVDAFRTAQPGVTVHVYPAGHGFSCDQRASYEAGSAALARQRTLAFLGDHIG